VKKIIFSDYEGTILARDGSTAKNAQAIDRWRAAGKKFVIATGQGFAAPNEVLVQFDYIITDGGREIRDANWELLYQEAIGARASKTKAIEVVLAREQITPDDAVTIGDGPNDVEMIEKYDGYAIHGTFADEMTNDKTAKSVAMMIDELLELAERNP